MKYGVSKIDFSEWAIFIKTILNKGHQLKSMYALEEVGHAHYCVSVAIYTNRELNEYNCTPLLKYEVLPWVTRLRLKASRDVYTNT